MAKPLLPLQCAAASGSVAEHLVFSTWRGRPYVRTKTKLARETSQHQQAIRAAVKVLSEKWTALGVADHATWDASAAAANVTPYNAFVGYNVDRWRRGKSLVHDFPALDTTPARSVTKPVCTSGKRWVRVECAFGMTVRPWLYAIYRQPNTLTTANWYQVVAFIEAEPVKTYYWDTPLDPGTYAYRVRGIWPNYILGNSTSVTLVAVPTG